MVRTSERKAEKIQNLLKLLFADDLAISELSNAHLQKILLRCQESLEKHGLKMNAKKTPRGRRWYVRSKNGEDYVIIKDTRGL